MVFQSYDLFPHMDVLGSLLLGPTRALKRPSKEVETEAMAALARVGLAGRGQSRPCELSGGQQQRVAVARALCYSPRLLLCDEPTGALDVDSRNELLDLFDQLHLSGHTVVLITHDPFVAARADRRYRVEGGLVREG